MCPQQISTKGVHIALTGGVDGAAAGDAVVVTVVLLAVVSAVAERTDTGVQCGQVSAAVQTRTLAVRAGARAELAVLAVATLLTLAMRVACTADRNAT